MKATSVPEQKGYPPISVALKIQPNPFCSLQSLTTVKGKKLFIALVIRICSASPRMLEKTGRYRGPRGRGVELLCFRIVEFDRFWSE